MRKGKRKIEKKRRDIKRRDKRAYKKLLSIKVKKLCIFKML